MNDKPPFPEIYETHYADVWRFLLHATADVTTALDLTSSTFFRALRAWPDFKPGKVPIRAWLIRIAINEWRREWRRRRLSRLIPLTSLTEPQQERLTVDAGEVAAVTEALEKAAAYRALRAAIRKLPGKYETVILLYYFQDLTLEQVASVLGRPVGTVKSLVHRAIAKLREDQGLREACDISFFEAKPLTVEQIL